MAKVLIVGNGGREHALAWALSRSPQVEQVFAAPGNGGTQWHRQDGTGLNPAAPCSEVAIGIHEFDRLIAFAREQAIDLTVVGPEVPLAEGIVDAFQAAGLRIFGPVQAAAQLEASKAFSKDIMTEQGIPTGEYFITENYYEARQFLEEYKKPVVIKASGLAAGKGVLVTDTREEAGMALHQVMVDRAFGEAGEIVIIEEHLQGREISVLAFCDGKIARPMIVARDYKRALDGNKGLNTGGMGAIAPVTDISPALLDEIMRTAIQPVLAAMQALDTPYKGILYAGLMLTDEGPKVLEYNCRFGDPETQVILPLLKTDLYEIMLACINGTLDDIEIAWHDAAAATVVCAAGGYPAAYEKGKIIDGLRSVQDAIVFHAGTRRYRDELVTSGGRVLAVTAVAQSLEAALEKAYAGVQSIRFEGKQYRNDIGAVYE